MTLSKVTSCLAPAAHVRCGLPVAARAKSGGYRTVHYYAATDVPVLMLALIDKGERANLSKAERNELRKELSGYAVDYRASVKKKVSLLKRGKT